MQKESYFSLRMEERFSVKHIQNDDVPRNHDGTNICTTQFYSRYDVWRAIECMMHLSTSRMRAALKIADQYVLYSVGINPERLIGTAEATVPMNCKGVSDHSTVQVYLSALTPACMPAISLNVVLKQYDSGVGKPCAIRSGHLFLLLLSVCIFQQGRRVAELLPDWQLYAGWLADSARHE